MFGLAIQYPVFLTYYSLAKIALVYMRMDSYYVDYELPKKKKCPDALKYDFCRNGQQLNPVE
jgi:hypothetical protein